MDYHDDAELAAAGWSFLETLSAVRARDRGRAGRAARQAGGRATGMQRGGRTGSVRTEGGRGAWAEEERRAASPVPVRAGQGSRLRAQDGFELLVSKAAAAAVVLAVAVAVVVKVIVMMGALRQQWGSCARDGFGLPMKR